MKASHAQLILALILITAALTSPFEARAEPQELTNLRQVFKQRENEAVRPVREQYLRELNRLEDFLTSRKDLEGALAVRKEMETLQGLSPAGPATAQPCQYLADMQAVNVKVGYGQFTTKNSEKVGGIEYFKSMFAHAPSHVEYNLRSQNFAALKGKAGMRDGGSSDSVEFMILGDGKILWRASLVGNKHTLEFTVPIRGVQKLELQVSDLGDATSDWSIWLDPQVCR